MATLVDTCEALKAYAFNNGLEFNARNLESASLALLVPPKKKLPLWLCVRLGRSYVAMVNEPYDCTIRQQPHDDTLMLFIGC